MIFKSFGVALVVASAIASEVHTVTHTNYIYPPGFKEQIDAIMKNNPSNETAGIQVKFVYEDTRTMHDSATSTTPAEPTYAEPNTYVPPYGSPQSQAFEPTPELPSTTQAPWWQNWNWFASSSGSTPVAPLPTLSTVEPVYSPSQEPTTGVPNPSDVDSPTSKTVADFKFETVSTSLPPEISSNAPLPSTIIETDTKTQVNGHTEYSTTTTTAPIQSKFTEKVKESSQSVVTESSQPAPVTQRKKVTTTKDETATEVVTKTTRPVTYVTSQKVTVRTKADVVSVETVTNDGVVSTFESTVAETVMATNWITYTTTATEGIEMTTENVITSTKDAKTINETSTITQNRISTAPPKTSYQTHSIIFTTAVTTTSTLFSATTVPTTTYVEPSETHVITVTQENPLVTQPVVTSTIDKTIATDTFTKNVTVTQASQVLSLTTKGSNTTKSTTTEYQNTTLTLGSTTLSTRVAILNATDASSAYETTLPVIDSSRVGNDSNVLSEPSETPHFVTTSIPVNITVSRYSNESDSATSISTSYSLTTSLVQVESSEESSASISIAGEPSSSTSESSSTVIAQHSSLVSSSLSSSSSQLISTSPSESANSPVNNGYSGDLFAAAIDTADPPSVFFRDELPLGVPVGVDNGDAPFQTNKFYSNLFLGQQTDMVFSWPYGLFWRKTDYYGFGIQHNDPSKQVFGTGNSNNADTPSYFYNPTQQGELLFAATSFSENKNNMRVKNQRMMSVTVELAADAADETNFIEIPVVQGMGFVTAIYHGSLTALVNSVIGVETFTRETSDVLPNNVQKYRASLFTGVDWLIYVTLPNGVSDFELTASDPYNLKASGSVDGLIIQIAKAPTDSGSKRDGTKADAYFDQAAGMYVDGCDLGGSVNGASATYSFDYSVKGESQSQAPLVFVLPHHVASLSGETRNYVTSLQLASSTKGMMTGFLTPQIIMSESLNSELGFLPQVQGQLTYSPDQLSLLASVANEEIAADIPGTVQGMGSNYFSGKVLDKYAYILLVISDVLKDDDVAKATLEQVKKAFDQFLNNKQTYPLMYDTRYKGVTSSSAQEGDTGADFGSSYYNDHHFHYGYFVHAAAIVGYIDKKYGGSWADDNKEWVNSLIRDVANPSDSDTFYPQFRSFDWFSGHSWAAGLFASGDGKNQESSSEDYNFSYGMKLWGQVIGDGAMEARGDLMLAVTKRSMNDYIYFSDGNDIVPTEYQPNRVAGIIFENKMAYTTFFGAPDKNPEYVHGIHMIPLTPVSSMIRGSTFVEQEWDSQISTFLDNVDSGWTGILRLNQALFDPKSAYEFFSDSNWNPNHLDNGMSRTWSLALSAGLANAA
ncbi:hypothetical protein DIURU_002444 [Diutina rugosa]|uniref:Glucan endo-1,3-beta-D-glucosidase 1 n=1 Tax=Diutina rugosa TaxID=5481 RepID=A0A642UQK4_DIURU|nr:uncharacterized protein DIURU_002444 [Diutina rugosa]KAA8903558.1 hypothetical protein DIURU_002444 [Diutina rugosa]